MKRASLVNLYSVIIVVLLVLTAWGNAVAMSVTCGLAIVISVLLFGRHFVRRGAVAAAVGFIVAIVIAILLHQA